MWGETENPITGRATAIVMTGASWHHYLALGDLRNVLAGFFAAHVLAPGVYVPADGFDSKKIPLPVFADAAARQGAALLDLAAAIAASEPLRGIRPQA
jgi:FMN reductase